jgi:hypothetical protein
MAGYCALPLDTYATTDPNSIVIFTAPIGTSAMVAIFRRAVSTSALMLVRALPLDPVFQQCAPASAGTKSSQGSPPNPQASYSGQDFFPKAKVHISSLD